MKKTLTALSILIILTACSKTNNEVQASDSLKWYNLEEGLKLGKQQQKPVLVDFYADWCSWCKKMDKEVFNESSVKNKLKANFILVKIDTESDDVIKYQGKKYSPQEFMSVFKVTGLPTLLFIDKEGQPVTKLPGFVPADQFKPILEYIQKECYTKNVVLKDFISGKTKCN